MSAAFLRAAAIEAVAIQLCMASRAACKFPPCSWEEAPNKDEWRRRAHGHIQDAAHFCIKERI